MDADDVLVADGGGGAGLAQKTLAGGGDRRQLRGHHFDRDHALQPLVERLQHDAEPAPAEDRLDLVMSQAAERAGPGGRLQEG
jgi:hypothetical protein